MGKCRQCGQEIDFVEGKKGWLPVELDEVTVMDVEATDVLVSSWGEARQAQNWDQNNYELYRAVHFPYCNTKRGDEKHEVKVDDWDKLKS